MSASRRVCSIGLLAVATAFVAATAAAAHSSAARGPSGYAVTDSLKVGGEGGWDALIVDPSAHRLYLSRSTHVQVIDLVANIQAGDIPNTAGVHGIALVPATGEGYTSNGRDSTVTVFNLKTLERIATIHLQARNPDAILYDPFSARVFTFNGGSSNATVIDVHTRQVAGRVELPGKPEFAVSDSAGKVYVNLEDKNSVAQLDARALKVLNVWPLGAGEEPTGIALDRRHRRLISGCGNGHAVVLNTDTGSIVADLPVGRGVDGAEFDPSSGLAFIPAGMDGSLTVIREESPDKFVVLDTVPTRRGARTLALDPLTHRVYLPTAAFGPSPPATAERPHPRPSILPGTFEVLVASR